jgi:hypothetical protein
MSRDHTTAPDMELVTPVSYLVSSPVCPSQQPDGSTEIRFSAGSPDSQVCHVVRVAWFYNLKVTHFEAMKSRSGAGEAHEQTFFAVGDTEVLYSFTTEVSEYNVHFLLSMYSMNH